MKKLLLLFTIMPCLAFGQTQIDCSKLFVTNIVIDNNNLAIDITILNGDTNFINYPYISLVINGNGDTIVQNSSFNFFGHMQGDTQTYIHNLTDTVFATFPFTVYFIGMSIMGVQDSCVLSYTGTTGIHELPIPNKQLLYITDILGRTTYPVLNQILFYIYDDGSVEKKIRLER